MTRKPKPADPYPIQTAVRPQSTRQRGLSKEIVNEIYVNVLGVDISDPADSVAPVEPTQQVDRTPQGRFNRGVSGNPKGRPKREEPSQPIPPAALASESLSAIVLRHGARKVKAHSEQGEVELTLVEAAMTKMVREAIKGNTGHSRTFMQLIGRAEAEDAKRKREAFRYWSEAKERATQLYLQAEQAGDDPPLSIHPEDINLYADGAVEIVGPTNPNAIKAMRLTQSRVDYHILNIAYAQWVEQRSIRLRGRRVEGTLFAELCFCEEQKELPPRLKMTLEEVTERLQDYSRYAGRVLHGFLREKAKQRGYCVPPRESRERLIVPAKILEFADENKINLRQLLPIWLSARNKLAQQQLVELMTALRAKANADE